MTWHTGNRRFTGVTSFDQPTVISPRTVALLPDPYADGAICPVTDDPENPVYVRKGGAWIPLGGGGAGSSLATFEPLTADVDYNDLTAVDPTPGLVFTQQAEIDNFLTSQGATAFKHVQAVWEALPVLLKHDITLNLAAGVHIARTDSSDYAFWFGDKLQMGGNIRVTGALPSAWGLVDPALEDLVIDSFSVGLTGDPYLDFSASNPGIFTGMDLRGRFARLSTGQLCLIVRHTNDRLFIAKDVSPAPGPADTASVVKQSTVLRNSSDNVNTIHLYGGVTITAIAPYSDYLHNAFYLDNLLYETPSTGMEFGFQSLIPSGWVNITGCTLDALRFAGSTYVYGFQISAPAGTIVWNMMTDCSFLAPTSGSGWTAGYVYGGWNMLSGVYVQGFGGPLTLGFGGTRMMGTVLDAVGSGWMSMLIIGSAVQYLFDSSAFGGRRNEILNGAVGVKISRAATHEAISYVDNPWPNVNIWFKNNTGACLLVGDNTCIDLTYDDTGGLKDGGGNTDVGIEVQGPLSSVRLRAGTTVTGALGDVRFADGDIWNYANILAQGPITDVNGNLVKKLS